MKKTSSSKAAPPAEDELRAEYDFDYSQAKPNRFAAGRAAADTIAVVLDPDVAQVFRDSESVNTVLRAIVTSLPPRGRGRPKAAAR